MKKNDVIKIARVVTVPIAFIHNKAFFSFLEKRHADVTLISSPGKLDVLSINSTISFLPLKINREINLFSDVLSLLKLILIFRKYKFDLIHSSTPKAGLLVALAGVFNRKTVRIHTFTGQRWATTGGALRLILRWFDKIIIQLNNKCYADSPSQIEFLENEGIAKKGQVYCLHKGSYGGVDTTRFRKEKFPNARDEILSAYKFERNSILILFVGRITQDKGVSELVRSFSRANLKNSKLKLILLGPYESDLDPLDKDILNIINTHQSIVKLGYSSTPEYYFSGADIFCLPSYREGFGTVVLEAAACGLPSIGTRIPGLVDSIVEGETGILVDFKNVDQLTDAILKLASDDSLRTKLGTSALERVRKDFDSNFLAQKQWDEYMTLLKKNV